MGLLYRGVNKNLDSECDGKLRPKGSKSSVTMKVGDEGLKVDGTWQLGSSENNAVRAHQLESGRHGGCFVSTTRDQNTAMEFATNGNMEDGFVYVIDEERLNKFGVIVFEYSNAANPQEKEVSLRAADNGDIPEGIIIRKYPVCVS